MGGKSEGIWESGLQVCNTAVLSSELLRSWQIISFAIQQMWRCRISLIQQKKEEEEDSWLGRSPMHSGWHDAWCNYHTSSSCSSRCSFLRNPLSSLKACRDGGQSSFQENPDSTRTRSQAKISSCICQNRFVHAWQNWEQDCLSRWLSVRCLTNGSQPQGNMFCMTGYYNTLMGQQ